LERQKSEGKLTARERVALLLDKGSFEEVDRFVTHRSRDFGIENQQYPGDGVVAGYGRIDGRSYLSRTHRAQQEIHYPQQKTR